MTDTPADDALRAAVERVELALSRFEATRIADLDWPTKVSVDPADLRLILSALTAQLEAETALDAAVAEAKALREALEDGYKMLAQAFNRIHALPRSSDTALAEQIGQTRARIETALARATLAQPAAKETI